MHLSRYIASHLTIPTPSIDLISTHAPILRHVHCPSVQGSDLRTGVDSDTGAPQNLFSMSNDGLISLIKRWCKRKYVFRHDVPSRAHQERISQTPPPTIDVIEVYLELRRRGQGGLAKLHPVMFARIALKAKDEYLNAVLDYVVADVIALNELPLLEDAGDREQNSDGFRTHDYSLALRNIIGILSWQTKKASDDRMLSLYRSLLEVNGNPNTFPVFSEGKLAGVIWSILDKPAAWYEENASFLAAFFSHVQSFISNLPPGNLLRESEEEISTRLISMLYHFIQCLLDKNSVTLALSVFDLLIQKKYIHAEAIWERDQDTKDLRTIVLSALIRSSANYGWLEPLKSLVHSLDFTNKKLVAHNASVVNNVIEILLNSRSAESVSCIKDLISIILSRNPAMFFSDGLMLQFFSVARTTDAGDAAQAVYEMISLPAVRDAHVYPQLNGQALLWLLNHMVKVTAKLNLAKILVQDLVRSSNPISLYVRARVVTLCAQAGFTEETRILWQRYAQGRNKELILGHTRTMLSVVKLFRKRILPAPSSDIEETNPQFPTLNMLVAGNYPVGHPSGQVSPANSFSEHMPSADESSVHVGVGLSSKPSKTPVTSGQHNSSESEIFRSRNAHGAPYSLSEESVNTISTSEQDDLIQSGSIKQLYNKLEQKQEATENILNVSLDISDTSEVTVFEQSNGHSSTSTRDPETPHSHRIISSEIGGSVSAGDIGMPPGNETDAEFAEHVFRSFCQAHEPLGSLSHESLNALARAATMIGDVRMCEHALSLIISRKEVPDIYDLNVVVSALAELDVESAWIMIEDMLENGVQPNRFTFATVVNGALVRGDIDKAFSLFKRFQTLTGDPGTLFAVSGTITSFIQACAQHTAVALHGGEKGVGAVRLLEYLYYVYEVLKSESRHGYLMSPKLGRKAISAALRLSDAVLAFNFWKLLVKGKTDWPPTRQAEERARLAKGILHEVKNGRLEESRGQHILAELGEVE